MSKKEEETVEINSAKSLIDLLKEKREKGNFNSSIFLPGDTSLEVKRLPVGLSSLDEEILGGGIPLGRVVELFGPESGGKTTLALQTIAAAQKAGKLAAFLDVEHALDLSYAEALGVDTENLVLAQPFSGEEAFDILYDLVDHAGWVVVDSTAALMPESDLENTQPGAQARIISQGIRKLLHKLSVSQCTILFISQLRSTISSYGPKSLSTGGNALKFYASVRLEIKIKRREGVIRKGIPAGNIVSIKSVKNKTFPPFKEDEFNLIYGQGLQERKKKKKK